MDDPSTDIIILREASDITIRDLQLTRPPGKGEGGRNGIHAARCEGLTIDGVSVSNNKGENAGLKIENCTGLTVRNCLVRDYKTVIVEDRRDRRYREGFSFRTVDGNGMKFIDCKSAQITNNRIIETVFRPTKENRDKYDLGRVIAVAEDSGQANPRSVPAEPYNNWHQGSAVFFGTQESNGQHSVLSGNYIENAAQGFDIHADYITLTNNIVNGANVGAKAMHGSKHVIISNNQFSRVDLYGIMLAPGKAAKPASGDVPAKGSNVSAGTIITGNIISDYGFGDQYWVSAASPGASRYAISLEGVFEPGDPPLTDVVIANNIVYDTGRDKVVVDGKPQVVPPRYDYALMLFISGEGLKTMKIQGNIFHTGSKGISNVELPPQ